MSNNSSHENGRPSEDTNSSDACAANGSSAELSEAARKELSALKDSLTTFFTPTARDRHRRTGDTETSTTGGGQLESGIFI
jgi:hypothetical protein